MVGHSNRAPKQPWYLNKGHLDLSFLPHGFPIIKKIFFFLKGAYAFNQKGCLYQSATLTATIFYLYPK